MGKDDYLLYKKKIKGNENIPTSELEALQRQKPNRRLLGFPVYVWFYYWGQNTSDKARFQKKIQKLTKKYDQQIESAEDAKEVARIKRKKKRRLARLNRKLEKGSNLMQIIRPAAEPPEIYNDNLSKQTVSQMELYMRSKGFFSSNASYSIDTLKRKRIEITYKVEENKPHKLAEINYIVEDSAIAALVGKTENASFLKHGDNYDVEKMALERERLEKLLRDNGYYAFNRQYIEFEYDSTVANYTSDSINKILGERRVEIDVLIHNPLNGSHKTYTIDSVELVLNNNGDENDLPKESKFYKGITYSYNKNHYSKKVLNYKVFLRPGEKYSLQNTIETQRQLLNLDNFKFVNIAFITDTTGGKFKVRIITSPAKKFTTSEEIGVSVSNGVPGPTANITFKNRNVFGGFENFETSLRYTFEGVAASQNNEDIYQSQELTGMASLVFPHIIFPFNTRFKRVLNRYNPKSRLLSSYTFIDRPEYTRSNLRGSFIYTWQKGLYNFYSFSPIDVNLGNTLKITDEFLRKLADTRLIHSFRKAYVSSINGYYTYNNFVPGVNKNAKYFNFYAESGGTYLNLFKQDSTLINDGRIFDFLVFSYLKFSLDFRKYIPTGEKSTFASRINLGFARPYLTEHRSLPYEKYFFAGGSTSVRAWKPRLLGPGSYSNVVEDDKSLPEQPGEILIEMNLEQRFNIFGLFDGAWFVDAGNVWTYYKDEKRPNANFEWNRFYKEIAVGAGVGLRLNFSFFIVRADVAYKVIDPGEPLGKRLVIQNIGKARIEAQGGGLKDNPNQYPVLHFGINYPF